MSFNNTTGALTGTPNTVASATAYTITATNAAGSATRTFTLTVTVSCANGGECFVGNRGPGGGTIFYVATTPFVCGPTLATTCTYLEAAPTTGLSAWVDIRYGWSATTGAERRSRGTRRDARNQCDQLSRGRRAKRGEKESKRHHGSTQQQNNTSTYPLIPHREFPTVVTD
jgi:hypothetical protein